jgi:hypothetical protein
MDLRSSKLLVSLFSLSLVAACGGDDSGNADSGGSGTEGTAGTTAGDGGSNMTTPGTSNMTQGQTGDSTGTPPATSGTDSTGPGATDSTGGGADCETCVAAECGKEIAACLDVKSCGCWLECTADGGSPMECGMMCDGMPPDQFDDVISCTEDNCEQECDGGGGTDTGGMANGTYDPCENDGDCPMGTECNMFVGYCSIDCMGDDGMCPMPATGDSEPFCSGMSDNCILPCGDGETCPDDMECNMNGGPEVCVPN